MESASPLKLLGSVFSRIEQLRIGARHVVAAAVFVGTLRFFMELFMSTWDGGIVDVDPIVVVHSIAFYFGTFMLLLAAFSVLLHKYQKEIFPVLFVGIFAGLLPPLVDMVLPHANHRYNYFLEFSPTLFSAAQPVGESLVVWLLVFCSGVYAWYRSGVAAYFVFGAAVTYGAAQFGGWFVALVGTYVFNLSASAFALTPILFGQAQEFPSEQHFLLMQTLMVLLWVSIAFVSFLAYRPSVALALGKRPFAALWGVLLIGGAALSGNVHIYVVLQAFAVSLAFMLVQAENDYYDKSADAKAGRASTISSEDLIFIRMLMVLLPLAFLFFNPSFGVVLGLLLFLGFLYNTDGFRLKKHFLSASLIFALSVFLVLLSGYFDFNTLADAEALPLLALFAFAAGAVLNFRDYKDVSEDKHAGVETLYVVLQRYGIRPESTHKVLLTGLIVFSACVWTVAFFSGLGSFPQLAFTGFLLLVTAVGAYRSLLRPYLSTVLAMLHILFLQLLVVLVLV